MCYSDNMTDIALKVCRCSSKKDSSMVKNLEIHIGKKKRKKRLALKTASKWNTLKELIHIESNLIKVILTDDTQNLADADLASPPSSKTTRSSSLIVCCANSIRLLSEWLHVETKLSAAANIRTLIFYAARKCKNIILFHSE